MWIAAIGLRITDESIFRAGMSILAGLGLGCLFISLNIRMLRDPKPIYIAPDEVYDLDEAKEILKSHMDSKMFGSIAKTASGQLDRVLKCRKRISEIIERKFSEGTMSFDKFQGIVANAEESAIKNVIAMSGRMGIFSLELPKTEEIKQEVEKELAPTKEDKALIDSTVREKAEMIMAVDLDSLSERREFVQVIETFGADIIRKSSARNSILQKRMGDFSKAGGETSEISRGLADLSIKMRDLDPSALDFTKTGLLGKIFNPIRRYFERYKTADAEIASIVKTLDKGKNILKNDNTTLEIEQSDMRDLTKQLAQKIEMGTQLDSYLSNSVENAKASGEEEEKIKFIEEEILFPLRQRLMDFQQLLVVNQQGIIAMEVIRKNNLELIRAVDRAETVTISWLRVAVTVAGALYNQKIVLEKVQMLNETTSHMILSTSKMLKEQGVAIQRDAVEASITPETLKQAFSDTLSALDDISTFKAKALPQISRTIQEFKEIAEEGEQRLQKMEKIRNVEF